MGEAQPLPFISHLVVAAKAEIDPRTAQRALEGHKPRTKVVAKAILKAVAELGNDTMAEDLKTQWEKPDNGEG